MARRRSGYSGINKLRRTLRRADPEITKDIRQVIAEVAYAIELDAVAGAPKKEQDLVRSIEHKIGRDGLTAIIGPGAKAAEIVRKKTGTAFGVSSGRVRLSKRNKHAILQFFKGYWHEFGTKGYPERNIPPLPARPFMGPAIKVNEPWIRARVNRSVGKILERLSRG